MQVIATRLLGVFFITTALLKANSPVAASNSFAYLFEKFFGLQPNLSATHAYANNVLLLVIALEIVIGALLLMGWRRRRVLFATGALVAVFTAGLIVMAMDPLAPSCGCTGAIRLAKMAHMENVLSLGRNSLLLAAVVWLLRLAKR